MNKNAFFNLMLIAFLILVGCSKKDTETVVESTKSNVAEKVSDDVIDEQNSEETDVVTTTETSSNSSPSSNSKPSVSTSNQNNTSNQNTNSGKGHYEERQVCVQEAYDEQVLVKKGACTDVLVSEAYDTEEIVYLPGAYYGADTQEVNVCNDCGEIVQFAGDHADLGHGGCHNEFIPITDPYWHNVEYKTVHHDAVYQTRCEPDEYKTVHHDAVYETQKIWVED